MGKWKIVYTKQAQKDARRIAAAGLKDRTLRLISILEVNPFQTPPPYEKLLGDLKGAFSRRINIKHRLIYQVYEKEKVVKIIPMWTHYE